jgi:hypothetical protein
MSTLAAAPSAADRRTRRRLGGRAIEWGSAIGGALLVLLIHGYHPYSSDGSIYVAGICKVLSPGLYAADGDFVGAHMRLSIFSSAVAQVVWLLHLPLDVVLFAGYLICTALALLVAGRLARLLMGGERARWGAMLLLTACFPMPVAATSLLLSDPYLSARSITLPLTLLALLMAVERRWWRTGACWALIGVLHPLMGAHMLLFLGLLFLAGRRQWRGVALLCGAVLAGAAVLHLSAAGVSSTPAYAEAVASRAYYFLARWAWYEVLGLVAPLVLLALVWRTMGTSSAAGRLAAACVLASGTCALASLCFVHPAQADLLMRVQPLRAFHTTYLVGTVLLGGWLAERLRGWQLLPLGAAAVGLAGGMYLVERDTYRPVSHIDLPAALGGTSTSAEDSWQMAFLWVRANTPAGALFAVDPDFLEAQGESMPGFRAVAERSILTDVKDEGLASLFPRIAPAWAARRDLEAGLNTMSDADRARRLAPVQVTWLLLSPGAVTRLPCPFRNRAAQVCRLPGGSGGSGG